MPDYQERGRFLYLETPLGQDQVLLKRFGGHEAISQLFHFQLDCVVDNAIQASFEKVIGQKVSFGVIGEDDEMGSRHFNGTVITMSQGARDRQFTDHTITVVPDIWKLTQKFRARIFQQTTVPDILKKVLQGFDVAYEIVGSWEPREYCVQYQESDFDFICRLMEEEGIFYFFKFTKGSHKMVVANAPQSHVDIAGDSRLIYEGVAGGLRDEERVSVWNKQQNWGAGKWTLMDHHSQIPHKKLDADKTVIDSVQVGKVAHKLKLAGNEDLEIYEHPARYAQRFEGIDKGGSPKGDLQKIYQDNKRTAGIRMQQSETPMLRITGASNLRHMMAGHKFSLTRHYNADGTYVLLDVQHNAAEGSIRSESHGGDDTHYGNSFSCLPQALPYVPPRTTKRPIIPGLQSAVVVGPSGEEIFTDKYGRVKVQFHWDRDGQNNQDSSCWLQVASPWAGGSWGMISIPRIGQEVLVMFRDGDPDHPVCIGSVYNPEQMPPYELPKHKTVATWKSRPSKGGAASSFNELRIEDSKSNEQMFIHGEKNMDMRVKEESREYIGKNKHKIIKLNEKIKIEQSKYTEVTMNEVTKIGMALTEKIGTNLHTKVGMNHEEKVGMKYALDSGVEIHLKSGMNLVIESGVSLTLKVGGNFVNISPAGVAIQGTMVLINSGGAPGAGSGASPEDASPDAPDTADDGTCFDKLGGGGAGAGGAGGAGGAAGGGGAGAGAGGAGGAGSGGGAGAGAGGAGGAAGSGGAGAGAGSGAGGAAGSGGAGAGAGGAGGAAGGGGAGAGAGGAGGAAGSGGAGAGAGGAGGAASGGGAGAGGAGGAAGGGGAGAGGAGGAAGGGGAGAGAGGAGGAASGGGAGAGAGGAGGAAGGGGAGAGAGGAGGAASGGGAGAGAGGAGGAAGGGGAGAGAGGAGGAASGGGAGAGAGGAGGAAGGGGAGAGAGGAGGAAGGGGAGAGAGGAGGAASGGGAGAGAGGAGGAASGGGAGAGAGGAGGAAGDGGAGAGAGGAAGAPKSPIPPDPNPRNKR